MTSKSGSGSSSIDVLDDPRVPRDQLWYLFCSRLRHQDPYVRYWQEALRPGSPISLGKAKLLLVDYWLLEDALPRPFAARALDELWCRLADRLERLTHVMLADRRWLGWQLQNELPQGYCDLWSNTLRGSLTPIARPTACSTVIDVDALLARLQAEQLDAWPTYRKEANPCPSTPPPPS